MLFSGLLSAVLLSAGGVVATPHKRNSLSYVEKTPSNAIFELGGAQYLAATKYPATTVPLPSELSTGASVAFTVLDVSCDGPITREAIENTIASYSEQDDVFTEDFLEGVFVTGGSSLSSDAVDCLLDMGVKHVMYDGAMPSAPPGLTKLSLDLTPGPYLLTVESSHIAVNSVYRLYSDEYRTFMYGAYQEHDGSGNFTGLDYAVNAPWSYPAIPVPSRLHYLHDDRPFAGYRLGVKDIYDMQGLTTTGGSRAWAWYNTPAEANAVSVQRLIDLGAVPVGRQKTAQFASGAAAWETIDYLYPFNARGDGWLTCAASSSGGGCSMGAYDWLDVTIGSDTGGSVRYPAAVNNLYGLRPSQGLMDLTGVQTLVASRDTSGIFLRDPYKWASLNRAWYTPDLYQSSNTTGLSSLADEVKPGLPKTLVYPTDYLPLNNSAAQAIMDAFIDATADVLGLEIQRLNFTAAVQNASSPDMSDFATFYEDTANNLNTQYDEVGRPLIEAWAAAFDGRFPPIDPARRESWMNFTQTPADLAAALERKRAATAWYESEFQPATADSCSASLMIGDISTGGVPSFRERDLNFAPYNSTLIWQKPAGAAISWSSICPLFGCADATVPIGQVSYLSPVTGVEEMWPVTASLVVKRGCDGVLFEIVERLADAGALKEVKTGRTAF